MKELFSQYLKNFQILSDDEINLIVDNTEVKKFKKGSDIPSAKNCFLVLQGCVREYLIKDGIEKSVAFYSEGDSMTPPSTLNGSERNRQCVEECILTISNQNIEKEMCELIPRLRSLILDEVQIMSEKIKENLAIFISSSPEERYKNILENKPTLLQRVPQHQIASYLGVTPESLSRMKKRIHDRKG